MSEKTDKYGVDSPEFALDVEYRSSSDEVNSSSESNSFFAYLSTISKKLDSLGVETRGIERIPPYERSTNKRNQLISVMGFWFSACGGLSSMSSFFLGPLLFGLGFKASCISGILGSTLGCAIAAYCSLMGPRSGCRQMVSARFLFGWWFVKPVALVSVLGVTGYSVVNSVVGGQILTSVSNGKVPLYAGIIIVAGISFMVAICGIKQLLRVETFFAIPVNLAFLLLYIASRDKYQYVTTGQALDSGALRGGWFSFFSLCYSTTATWGTIASDYYILFPEDTPDVQIFTITFLGICIPTTFVGVLGLLIGNVALTYEPWQEVWATNGMGGLLVEAFNVWGAGGKFLSMLLFVSLISNNILNTYSAAFGIQLSSTTFTKVPRWLWAIVVTGVVLVAALVGRNKFSTILGNFLPMVGYWISMYFIMLLEENSIFRTDKFIHLYTKEFRRDLNSDSEINETGNSKSLMDIKYSGHKKHYNFAIWNDYHKLTMGFAAAFSFICGAAGAAVGMSQAYWVGPVAKAVGGPEGGDVAMWLCMGFSGLVYPVLRYFELKKFGR